jgi:hypothetical protein
MGARTKMGFLRVFQNPETITHYLHKIRHNWRIFVAPTGIAPVF